ncbi:hypothetical protein LTR97_003409 [Elasticomyces elasticus]|uniref:Uncharacterized protein n=1 Tax=Elasticomyces elasticus TaxID=574655 RepID=A0AAN7W9Z4_9PEZI|nr:hypothetical protein LTR97_003409 [Elasticomyces elasticus]
MCSLRKTFLLVACATQAIAGPLPRYSNNTSSRSSASTQSTSTSLTRVADIASTTQESATNSTVSSTYVNGWGSSSSSAQASAYTTYSGSAAEAQTLVVSTSLYFSYAPATSNASIAITSLPATSGENRVSSTGTTTLTFYTTVPPSAGSTYPRTKQSEIAAATSNSEASTSEFSQAVDSTTTASATSSSPAVYGSVTLTYSVSSETATGALTLLPTLSSAYGSSDVSASTSVVASEVPSSGSSAYDTPMTSPTQGPSTLAQSTEALETTPSAPPVYSANQYPTASSTASASSSAAQTTLLETSNNAPSLPPYVPTQSATKGLSDYFHMPPSSSGLPEFVSQYSYLPSNTHFSYAPSAAETSVPPLAGITIVPISPSSSGDDERIVTVTVTTTQLDAGKTTTVAEQTVTISGY